VAADLGAQTPDGFVPVDALGFGRTVIEADPRLAAALPGAITGAILTVSTVTGSAERAGELSTRHPDSVGEAMEGFGVAVAAEAFGVPFAEIRAVSNVIGPRDRDAWRIPDALASLSRAARAVGTLGG
jgi:futalosine hydrolase